MDTLVLIVENSQTILLLISILLAVITRYFGAKASLIAQAAQALVDLQQEFLNDIRDGIISQDELNQLLQKVEAASQALKDALNAFIQPVPLPQKVAIIFGGGDLKGKIAQVNAQVQSMRLARFSRR